MAKKTIELPLTLKDVEDELVAMLADANQLLKETTESVRRQLDANFTALGGCHRCGGRGWVVVWDTMDMMDGSCAEYGPCDNVECTKESREKSGLRPSYSKYDGQRGVRNPLTSHVAFDVIVKPLQQNCWDLERDVAEISRQRNNFTKGDDVVVVKGRKHPIGHRGKVAWVSANTGGVLVKPADSWQDRSVDGIWVNPANLEKVKEA